ncbi:hypothetical protein [Streptosporangium sp. KLBMP 9127]|nr:hypothetical protein [Streptosporangium sp. KLBMP 9127]
MRSNVKKLLLAAMAAMMLTATAGTAHAADTAQTGNASAYMGDPAYNTKELFLTANPKDDMADGRVIRSIDLRAGRYRSSMVVGQGCSLEFNLPAGTYSWRGLLDPKDGYYRESAILEGPVTVHLGYCSWKISSSGTVRWGTKLVPLSF